MNMFRFEFPIKSNLNLRSITFIAGFWPLYSNYSFEIFDINPVSKPIQLKLALNVA
jgi:hypothetical protein